MRAGGPRPALGTLLVAAVIASGACAEAPTAVQKTGLVQVERVDVVVSESLPVQVSVRVQGVIGDGCTSLDAITQRREGNTITVTITTVRQGEVCTLIAQLFNQTIRLQGDFPPGDYLVRVNGFEVRFRV